MAAQQVLTSSNSSSSSSSFFKVCQNSTGARIVYVPYTIVTSALLPLYVFVLYVGLQRRRRRRPASHSDVFTYHMVAIEALGVLGSLLFVLSIPTRSDALLLLGVYGYSLIFPGQTLFHLLTCVERYLAVAHALAYMRLGRLGVRVRNAGVAWVWLFSAGWLALTDRYFPAFPAAPFLAVTGACMLLTCSCCLAVLRALTRGAARPGPARKRALRMVGAITALLVLRFLGLLLCFGLENLLELSEEGLCLLMDAGLWLTVPSSLLLPLLFLHRTGRTPRCCPTHREPGTNEDQPEPGANRNHQQL